MDPLANPDLDAAATALFTAIGAVSTTDQRKAEREALTRTAAVLAASPSSADMARAQLIVSIVTARKLARIEVGS